MSRLLVSLEDRFLCELPLDRERTRLGRSRQADIQLDDLAVSGEHARITTILGDSFLEDLDSTTGTAVNGTPVKKHVLSTDDIIGIGPYRLRYEATGDTDEAEAFKSSGEAALRLLTGPQAGSVIPIAKACTRFGDAGVQVAAVVRTRGHYVLRHVEGERYPLLNGCPLVPPGQLLRDGDLIELGGHRLKFQRDGT